MSGEKRQPTLAMKREAAQQRDRAQYGAKRDMILKAAGPVLERNGFAGTTIDAIAKEAGLDRATVYYYFADKGAIFREAMHDGLADMIAALEEVAASGDPPEMRLRNSMRVLMRSFEQHYPSCISTCGAAIRRRLSTNSSIASSSPPAAVMRTWSSR